MQRALTETERRRAIQLEYNRVHNITPATIKKSINDAISVYDRSEEKEVKKQKLTPALIKKQIVKLRNEMFKAAADLEFEKAAKLRDEVHELEKLELDL
jgi:excinuclease ABC subunit B